MWKVIVKTDIKEIHETREQGIEVDFCQNFPFGKKDTTFIIFVFKCTLWQMTCKYLTCLILVFFIDFIEVKSVIIDAINQLHLCGQISPL